MVFAIAFIVGLIIGSFVNVVSYRLPLSIQGETYQGKPYSVTYPVRSICPNCQTQLGFLQLIPLLSFFIQQGKCPTKSRGDGGEKRYEEFGWDLPRVEVLIRQSENSKRRN